MRHFVVLTFVLAFSVSSSTAEETSSKTEVEFNRDVRPILAEKCFACHGFDEAAREADLRLDTFEGATTERAGIVAITPGRPDASELVSRITAVDLEQLMPPRTSGKQLTPAEIDTLHRWIEQGARYATHWAFIPPERSSPRQVPGVHHPVDQFIQSRLAKEQIRPSLVASHETLIRRLSLDLVGLPPTPAEVDSFLATSGQDAEGAYRDLVDRLLASPHYGERWGRWWLDQARYADSHGYSIDGPRQIWKFRDWVINAMNADMPFDTFTIEQLAGDLLPDATQSQKIATGFHRNTQINQEGGVDKEQYRVESIFDRVATTGTVWLGLSVGCAQCHDHKFDPITQEEFYQLFAFLNNQDEPSMKIYKADINVPALKKELQETEHLLKAMIEVQTQALTAWEEQLTEDARRSLPKAVQKALSVANEKRTFSHKLTLFRSAVEVDDQFRKLNARRTELDGLLNRGITTLVMQERSTPRTTTVFVKGDFTRPADEVTPGTPAVLQAFEHSSESANRLDLARWIVSPANPLTARVIVNRIWQHYFGRGLVQTENDFGFQGTLPTHPELLDWLAVEFMERGWSLKEMHRLIVTSHTYRQSSSNRTELKQKDPDNVLLARQHRLRLDAEIVRDVALRASGLFSPKLGGPPVYPPIPDGVMSQGQVKRAWHVSEGEDRFRRGLYTFVYRATPPPSLNVFDAPDGYSTCTCRIRSNTPLQALTLMNDEAFFEFARSLEKIIQRDGLETAFRRCTSRPPTSDELATLQKLDTLTAARLLLNLDETITRE